MSTPGEDIDEALGAQQDSEIDPGGLDPREPITEVTQDQQQEIDPEAPAPR